jgi:tRNA threonylcarbamoyladenosine biosynthesis protein TsaB
MSANAGREPRLWLLAIDTATSLVVVAAGTPTGEVLASRSAPAEHRHGERLLGTIDALVADTGLDLAMLRGVVVGTGPGAFTGLRVGLATAKTLAHELGVAIAGVSTGEALLAAGRAAGSEIVVLRLPAGPHDRVEVRPGQPPRLLPGGAMEGAAFAGDEAGRNDARGSESSIAVDLAGRAPEADLERGAAALTGLPASLLRLGVARLAGGGDDAATLVPEYVMLPRGVGPGLDVGEGVSWSHDRP